MNPQIEKSKMIPDYVHIKIKELQITDLENLIQIYPQILVSIRKLDETIVEDTNTQETNTKSSLFLPAIYYAHRCFAKENKNLFDAIVGYTVLSPSEKNTLIEKLHLADEMSKNERLNNSSFGLQYWIEKKDQDIFMKYLFEK